MMMMMRMIPLVMVIIVMLMMTRTHARTHARELLSGLSVLFFLALCVFACVCVCVCVCVCELMRALSKLLCVCVCACPYVCTAVLSSVVRTRHDDDDDDDDDRMCRQLCPIPGPTALLNLCSPAGVCVWNVDLKVPFAELDVTGNPAMLFPSSLLGPLGQQCVGSTGLPAHIEGHTVLHAKSVLQSWSHGSGACVCVCVCVSVAVEIKTVFFFQTLFLRQTRSGSFWATQAACCTLPKTTLVSVHRESSSLQISSDEDQHPDRFDSRRRRRLVQSFLLMASPTR